MNAKKLEALFNKLDDLSPTEYLQFDNIPASERLHANQDICGLLKLYSLMKDPSSFEYHAEHDILYLADADELKEVTYDDALYLHRCGFHFDSEDNCIADFC